MQDRQHDQEPVALTLQGQIQSKVCEDSSTGHQTQSTTASPGYPTIRPAKSQSKATSNSHITPWSLAVHVHPTLPADPTLHTNAAPPTAQGEPPGHALQPAAGNPTGYGGATGHGNPTNLVGHKTPAGAPGAKCPTGATAGELSYKGINAATGQADWTAYSLSLAVTFLRRKGAQIPSFGQSAGDAQAGAGSPRTAEYRPAGAA